MIPANVVRQVIEDAICWRLVRKAKGMVRDGYKIPPGSSLYQAFKADVRNEIIRPLQEAGVIASATFDLIMYDSGELTAEVDVALPDDRDRGAFSESAFARLADVEQRVVALETERERG